MQPEKKKGPGVAAPEPRCIAYIANALSPYALRVIEGNRNAVGTAIARAGGFYCALVMDPTLSDAERAEAPENAL